MSCEYDSYFGEGSRDGSSYPLDDFHTEIIKDSLGNTVLKSIRGPGFRFCESFGGDGYINERYYINDRGIEMTEYFENGVCIRTRIRIRCKSGIVVKILDGSGKIISEEIEYDN